MPKPVESRKEVAPGIKQSRWKAVTPSTSVKTPSLYKAREKVFPKKVKGTFRTIKWLMLFLLLGIYYFVPFIRWDRGPHAPSQAVLVDFEHARLYFFFIEIWPQEIYYIAGLLILGALALFLASALFGRIWCGFTCPQTIWTDLFITVEHFFEGDRNQQLRLEKQPWTINKISRKLGKHVTWLVISFLTGGAWILYFHDAPSIIHDFFIGHAPMTAYVFAGILTLTTYSLAGFMREQFCIYMCPWPRIQVAMTDEDALNVTYRYDRGEPRGAHKKNASWDGRGDCIDCRQCVAVCPTGIDIRNGLQLECIGCSLCIDACNGIMDKIGRPRGLISYDTDKNILARQEGKKSVYNLVRPRTIAYAILMLVVAATMLYSLLTRSVLDMNILRDRVPNYVQLQDGSIRNGYTVKILNKAPEVRELRLAVEGFDGAKISVVGVSSLNGEIILSAPPDNTIDYRVYIAQKDIENLASQQTLIFRLTDIDNGDTTKTPTTFVTGEN